MTRHTCHVTCHIEQFTKIALKYSYILIILRIL